MWQEFARGVERLSGYMRRAAPMRKAGENPYVHRPGESALRPGWQGRLQESGDAPLQYGTAVDR